MVSLIANTQLNMEKEGIEKKENLTPEKMACERLKQFVYGYLGMSQREFSASIGRSGSFVPNFKGKVRGHTRQKLQMVYPNLNLNWLETGEGEMIDRPIPGQKDCGSGGVKSSKVDDGTTKAELLAQIANLQAKLEEKEKLIMRQQESISNLIAMIGK